MLNLRDIVIISSLIYLICKYVIYPIFLSPLSKIPNAHPTSPLSPFWILWKRHAFQENRAIYSAHQKYGPVVRLAPNELSVNCVDNGLRTMYPGGFEKHRWYDLFANYDGVDTMFSTIESRPHSHRKRMMSNLYAKSTLQNSKGYAITAQKIVHERLMPLLAKRLSQSESVDVYQIFNFATMDLVNAYIFGLQSGSNFLQDNQTGDWWLGLYQSRKKLVFWTQELPRLTKFMQNFGIYLTPKWVAAANIKIEDWCLGLCDAAESCCLQIEAAHGSQTVAPEDTPTIYRALRNALINSASKSMSNVDSKSGSSLGEAQPIPQDVRVMVASEMLDQLSAGHETSSITLAFLFDELCLHPELQDHLRDELKANCPTLHHDDAMSSSTQATLPSFKELDSLPFLHAVLMETLRLHAAIPGPQPRVTPSATAVKFASSTEETGVRLGDFTNLPPNVRVSSSAYSLHRNATVFPNPESFLPDRWLPQTSESAEADAKRLAEMHRWFWAFSSGGRMCIGSNLAVLQMKLLTAVMIANFEFRKVSPNAVATGDAKVEPLLQEDEYTAQPIGKKLVLWTKRI